MADADTPAHPDPAGAGGGAGRELDIAAWARGVLEYHGEAGKYCRARVPRAILHAVVAIAAERDALRKDVADAAGELLVSIPEPGTEASKLLIANSIMRRQRDEAQDKQDAAEAERDALRRAVDDMGDALKRAMSLRVLGFNECHASDCHNETDQTGTTSAQYAAKAEEIEHQIRRVRALAPGGAGTPGEGDEKP